MNSLTHGGIVTINVDLRNEDSLLELRINDGDDVRVETIDLAPFSGTRYQLREMRLATHDYLMVIVVGTIDNETGLTAVSVSLDPVDFEEVIALRPHAPLVHSA